MTVRSIKAWIMTVRTVKVSCCFHRLMSLVMACVVLASCSTKTYYPQNDIENALPNIPAVWQGQKQLMSEIHHDWLAHIDDEFLHSYIHEALNNNYDIRIAKQHVAQAAAIARQSNRKPSVNGTVELNHSNRVKGGEGNKNIQLGTEVSWEADIWGASHANTKALENEWLATALELKYAQSSLAANVAKSYMGIIAEHQQLQRLSRQVDNFSRIIKITQVQVQEGVVSKEALNQKLAELASLRAERIHVSQRLNTAKRTLETMMGRYANASIQYSHTFPKQPPRPPAGLPSQMLERRADIVVAERQIAAATNRLHEAKTAKLPRFQLTANLGTSSPTLKEALNPSNLVWNAASSLLVPVFNAGKLDAQIDAAKAKQKSAVLNYAKVAHKAYAEVERYLDANTQLTEQLRMSEVSYAAAKSAYKTSLTRYRLGDISRLKLLETKQELLGIEEDKIDTKERLMKTRVNLYLALGGGW